MRRTFTRISLTASLLITAAACTQDPAQIDLKGQNSYGRNASNNAAPMVYSNAPTTQAAAVESIGVSDLSAPTAHTTSHSVAVSDVTPFQHAHPETPKPAASGNPKPVVAANTPVKALDSVIDNDGSDVATIAKPTPVVKTAAVVVTKQAPTHIASNTTFMWPVNSRKVISDFGPKGPGKMNDGINIASADGEPVWAAADGEVVYVGNELAGYGNMILIKHGGDKATAYAHLGKATVEKYDHVKQGDIIGYVGTTGNVKEPQLHFSIRDGKEAVNPMKYFDRKLASAE